MRHENIKDHLDCAELLFKGVKESLNVPYDVSYGYGIISPEHSDKSVYRRLVQIRQECLQAMKKLKQGR